MRDELSRSSEVVRTGRVYAACAAASVDTYSGASTHTSGFSVYNIAGRTRGPSGVSRPVISELYRHQPALRTSPRGAR